MRADAVGCAGDRLDPAHRGRLPRPGAFYRDVLRLPFIGEAGGAALFDLGDNTTLEVVAGGVARRPPAQQREAGQVMILRVPDFAAAIADLVGRGAAAPYKRYASAQGAFSYVVDPVGNLVGLADRAQPGRYVGALRVRPEDLEAQRGWVETNRGAAEYRNRQVVGRLGALSRASGRPKLKRKSARGAGCAGEIIAGSAGADILLSSNPLGA